MSQLAVVRPCSLPVKLTALARALSRAVCLAGLLAFGTVLTAGAADSRPIVGPGATKEEVLNAYGWPTGQSTSGTKEILNYPQGQVTLEKGRVERVDFSMKTPWPAPRPRPGAPTATTGKKVEAGIDFWFTNFEAAAEEAARRNARVLALFTGTDWSPPSKQFLDEVAFHPDFINAFTADFVFLRLDFMSRTPMAADVKSRNNELRERYGVTVYPTLLVLSPGGTNVGQVDLNKPREGENYRARVITAVRELRDQLLARPPPPDPVPVPTAAATAPATPGGTAPAAAPSTELFRGDENAGLASSLHSARWMVMAATAAGAGIAAFLFWLLWRKRTGGPVPRASAISTRISDAASGLPAAAELSTWPKDRLCALISALAEAEGFVPQRQFSGDKDIVLRRGNDSRPRVLVCCVPAALGRVPAKRVRELFGTLTAEGVEGGWFVAPAGFAADARSYADEHHIRLLDADALVACLHDLPPVLLPKALGRPGAS